MRKRLKIFALHTTRRTLPATGGDMINEARFLTALSRFADVYYNGQLFQPGVPGYGLEDREIVVPQGGYDLYYVRNNPELFVQLPSPKIVMAYPYVEDVFRAADAVVVTTEAWERGLTPYSDQNMFTRPMRDWYGDDVVAPKRVINIKQTIDPYFLEEPSRARLIEARAKTTGAKAIGFFGRIDSNTFPYMFVRAYKQIIEELPQVKFVVGGTVRIPLDPTIVKTTRIAYEKMPAMVKACVATATDEGNDAAFLGSGKVLDSMACGVPVIAYKTLTRTEQLGDYYPLYYENEEECCQRIREVIHDPDIVAEARRQMDIRKRHFLPDARAAALQATLEELVELRGDTRQTQ
ncbi:MAG: glycosyltransferase [Mesorhizobium sp.]|nr:glycosyltransferase [Mesorhizobium sp.]